MSDHKRTMVKLTLSALAAAVLAGCAVGPELMNCFVPLRTQ